MSSLSLSEIATALSAETSCLISAHISPDPDAIGSSFGLAAALQSLGKEVLVFLTDAVPERMTVLTQGIPVVHEIPARTFSALVVVDTASEKRVGPGVGELRTRAERTYNLDHHVSNVGWGERNYIDADAPASALIVWELCRELGVAVVPQIANLLYAGLLDDTGGFCFSNTNARSFRCAAALVDGGADPEKVANALYFNQPLRLLKLHALALQTLSLELGGRVSLISITARGLERCGAKAEDVEGIVDLARRVEGTQVAIFQRELDDGWKFSLRSKDPRIDVNEVAATFGGGGHTAAAGCKITGSEEEARDRVLRRVAEVLL